MQADRIERSLKLIQALDCSQSKTVDDLARRVARMRQHNHGNVRRENNPG